MNTTLNEVRRPRPLYPVFERETRKNFSGGDFYGRRTASLCAILLTNGMRDEAVPYFEKARRDGFMIINVNELASLFSNIGSWIGVLFILLLKLRQGV